MILTRLSSAAVFRNPIRIRRHAAALLTCLLAPIAARAAELAILSPSETYPLTVGSTQAPGRATIELEVRAGGGPVHGLRRADFTAEIGGDPAGVITVVELEDRYVLNLLPPPQDAIGLYDLSAEAAGTSQTIRNSVRYTSSSQINVDAVLTLDNSGSMSGGNYLELAKDAAGLFVDRMRPGDKLGVVSFHSLDRLVFPLTTISSANQSVVVFDDGGEAGTAGWSFVGSPWGTTTDNPHTGTNCWTDSPAGDYANLRDSYLITHVFSLEGQQSPLLSFWTRYDLEVYPGGGDYGRVFVIVGDGAPVLLEQYNGFQSTWLPKIIDLTAYAGQPQIRIAFNLRSDNVETRDGWYLDDIRIGTAPIGVQAAVKSAIADIVPEGATSIGSGLNRAQGQLAGSQAQGGSYCWTDSPTGNYGDSALTSIITPTLNFTGVADPRLEYWSSYTFEEGYDFGQVYATIDNGAHWTLLTEYTGSRPYWALEALDLTGYGGKPAVKLAFSVQSDDRIVYDGFYVDDVWIGSASNRSNVVFQDDMEHGRGAWTTLPDPSWDIIDTRGTADPSHPWAIILLSDGYENEPPFVDQILPSVLRTKTKVFTIALGPDSDTALLQRIASQSGGEFFSVPDANDLSYIYNSLASEVTGYQTLFSEAGQIAQDATVEQTALVDPAITEAIFSVNWPSGGNVLALTLIEPGGRVITPATVDPKINFIASGSGQSYQIKQPVSGEWKLKTFGATVPPAAATLSPAVLRDRAKWVPAGDGDTRPVRSGATLLPAAPAGGTSQVQFNAVVTGTAELSLMAHLYKQEHIAGQSLGIIASLSDKAPVTGATMVAKGTSPGGAFEVALLDDGAHGDGGANDGVYGGGLAATFEPGLYTFEVRAQGPIARPFQRIARGTAFIREADAFEHIRRYLLGIENNPAGLDVNGDGAVDAADLLWAGMQ